MLVGTPAVTTAVSSNGGSGNIKVEPMPLPAKSPTGVGAHGGGTTPHGPHGTCSTGISHIQRPEKQTSEQDISCVTGQVPYVDENLQEEQVVPSSVVNSMSIHHSVIAEAAQKVDLLRNCRGIRSVKKNVIFIA